MAAEVTRTKNILVPSIPPPPFPTIVSTVFAADGLRTFEDSMDMPYGYGVDRNKEASYESFISHCSITLPESATDLSTLITGVTLRQKPVRLRSTLRRPDG